MRIRSAISIMVAGAVLAIGGSTTEGSDNVARARTKTLEGEALLHRQEYGEAEKLFRKAIELHAALPSAHLGLGAALVGQHRYVEALDALAVAEKAYTDHQAQLEEAGRVAVEKMQETNRQVETLENTYNVFHQVPNEFGLPENVVGVMNVDDRSPVPPQLYFLQGVSLLRIGEIVEGVARLEQALQLEPTHALAHYNLAVALHSTGNSLEASRHLDAARAGGVEPPAGILAEIEAATDAMRIAETDQPD